MSCHSSYHDRILASPISSPPFTHDGHNLEVNRHARCASDRLYELLTYIDPGPVLTKQGKPRVHQPPPHKDPTGAFYEAQLVHYGLKPFKAKGPAKRALLAAFEANNGTLTVPEGHLRLERDLVARFAAENAAARKEYYAEKERERAAEDLKRTKRKREEEDVVAEVRKTTSKKRSAPLPPIERCGSYRIAAPGVLDGWDCPNPLVLKLALSSTGAHLWGSFDFGNIEGTLRSRSVLTATDRTVKFHWRGRETGEGETTYGHENVAEFTFLGHGKITGSMYWDPVGTFTIMGLLTPGPSFIHDLSDQVSKWKGKYWSINDANYEAERNARWGKWTWNRSSEEREPNSDSDGRGHFRDEARGDEEKTETETETEDEDEDEGLCDGEGEGEGEGQDEDGPGDEEGNEDEDEDDVGTNGTDEDQSEVDGIDPYPESCSE